MATITLYKDKLNGVGSLIDTMVSTVNNLDMQLGALKATLQGINSSTYSNGKPGSSRRKRKSIKRKKISIQNIPI